MSIYHLIKQYSIFSNMWRIHLDFINCIHKLSSTSPPEGSKSTVNIYSYTHIYESIHLNFINYIHKHNKYLFISTYTLESPKEIKPVNPEWNRSWIFIGRNDAEAETAILWPPDVKNWLIWKDWSWERLKVEGERDCRGWDGWMASPTQWIWVWLNSGSGWWTGRPGVLRFMGSQRVGHNWATELSWTEDLTTF